MLLRELAVLISGFFIVLSDAQGSDSGIRTIVQSGYPDYLMTLSAKRIVAVWKVGASRPIATYQVKGLPDGIAFHPTKKSALISDGSGFVEWDWSKEDSKPQSLFSPDANTKESIQDSNNVQRLDISTDGKVLAFRETLGNIKIQAIPDGNARVLAKVGLSSTLYEAWIRFIPGTNLLAFNDVGDIHVYDISRMREYCVLKGEKGDEISSLDVASDGKLLAVGYWKGSARVWNIEKKVLVKLIETGKNEQAIAVSFSQDGKCLCVGTTSIAVYQTKDMKLLSRWTGPKGGASAIVMTKDNNTVITVGEDPHPRYWDAKTGKEWQSYKD